MRRLKNRREKISLKMGEMWNFLRDMMRIVMRRQMTNNNSFVNKKGRP